MALTTMKKITINLAGLHVPQSLTYLQNANTMTSLRLPVIVSPLFILHVAVSIRSFTKAEDVRVGMIVESLQVWFEPSFYVKHVVKNMCPNKVPPCILDTL